MPPFLRRFLTFIIIVSYIGTTFTPTYGVLPPLKLTDEAEKSKAALTAKFDAGTSASSAEKLNFPTKAGKNYFHISMVDGGCQVIVIAEGEEVVLFLGKGVTQKKRYEKYLLDGNVVKAYFDIEVDPTTSTFLINQLKSTIYAHIDVPEYNVIQGNKSDFSTIFVDDIFQVEGKSFETVRGGINAKECIFLAPQRFNFGGFDTQSVLITQTFLGHTQTRSYAQKISDGSYLRASKGMILASQRVTFNFGDIATSALLIVPKSIAIESFHYLGGIEAALNLPLKDDFPVDYVRVYGANLYVDQDWYAFTSEINVRTSHSPFKLLVRTDREEGESIDLYPDSTHPTVRCRSLLTFASNLDVTSDNSSNAFGLLDGDNGYKFVIHFGKLDERMHKLYPKMAEYEKSRSAGFFKSHDITHEERITPLPPAPSLRSEAYMGRFSSAGSAVPETLQQMHDRMFPKPVSEGQRIAAAASSLLTQINTGIDAMRAGPHPTPAAAGGSGRAHGSLPYSGGASCSGMCQTSASFGEDEEKRPPLPASATQAVGRFQEARKRFQATDLTPRLPGSQGTLPHPVLAVFEPSISRNRIPGMIGLEATGLFRSPLAAGGRPHGMFSHDDWQTASLSPADVTYVRPMPAPERGNVTQSSSSSSAAVAAAAGSGPDVRTGGTLDFLSRPPSPRLVNAYFPSQWKALKKDSSSLRYVSDRGKQAAIWLAQKREKADARMAKFGKDPSWATWSTKDVARAAGFTLLETVGTVIDYGEAYARRGLRASGVSANAAQDITDGVFFLTNVIPARAGIKLLTQATRSVRIEHRARYALDLAVARDTRVVWGRGIQVQGMPWEDYIAQQMSTGSRLPAGFKTFDFYDRSTKTATSVKTLNTLTEARLSKPESIYSSLKKSIDDTVNFPGHRLDGTVLTTDMIQVKRLELAIPKGTPAEQMVEVLRAVDYAEINGVIMKVTVAP